MKTLLTCVLLLVATLSACNTATSSTPTKPTSQTRLFVLSGQSNMVRFQPPMLAALLKKQYPNDQIVIVKNAHSGQPLWRWCQTEPKVKPILKRRGRPHPGTPGDLYEKLIDAIKATTNGSLSFDSVSFVWLQGEADGLGGSPHYASQLKELLAQLRRDLQAPKMNAAIIRIANGKAAMKTDEAKWQFVRDAQVQVAKQDPLVEWIDSDNLPMASDGIHYKGAALQTIGQRVVKQLAPHLK